MILVSGSLAYDYIMDFPGVFSDHILPDKIHMLNVSFLVPQMHKSYGGTAGNIAYNLALLGLKPVLFGKIGTDFEQYNTFLKKNGIDTSKLSLVSDLYTSTAFGITDKNDNQIWGFYPGADNLSNNLSVKKLGKKIDFAVIAPNNPKAMMKFAGEFTQMRIPYLFDPGMQLRWLSGNDLKTAFRGAKVIIGNDYEITVMEKTTGIKNLHSLSEKNKIVITTLGNKGSKISWNSKTHKIPPAKPERCLDPSGAGDAYRSGFLAGFLRNLDVETCGKMGSLSSVYTVEKYGTTTHYFTMKEFCKRYEKNFGKKLNLPKFNN